MTLYAQASIGAMASLDAVPMTERVINSVLAYGWYATKAIFPFGLAPLYQLRDSSSDAITIARATCICFFYIAIVALVIRRRPTWIGCVWFFISLLPMSGLLQAGPQAVADRYFYQASLAVPFLLAGVIERLKKLGLHIVSQLILGLWLCVFAVTSAFQARVWTNSETFCSRVLDIDPDSIIAWNNLGRYYLDSGADKRAEVCFWVALRLAPSAGYPNLNMGEIALMRKDYARAEVLFNTALKAGQGYVARAHTGLAFSALHRDQPKLALTHFLMTVANAPEDPVGYLNTASLLSTCTNTSVRCSKTAIKFAQRAIRLSDAPSPNLLRVLSMSYAADGQFLQALQAAIRARQLCPHASVRKVIENEIMLYRMRLTRRESDTYETERK